MKCRSETSHCRRECFVRRHGADQRQSMLTSLECHPGPGLLPSPTARTFLPRLTASFKIAETSSLDVGAKRSSGEQLYVEDQFFSEG